ncbi:hypothetical protein Q8W71_09215 [Methylobacterium sp. NEAU 140]|uniref:hypothetical protein n=1 Tax=Methylobacterium sp. NEAU 140 TaxID=3064945 RepID=UPI002734C00C|nr:hypothetical protein [Methylobacterium sp. NEAU 140]MDP4022799.1 hypothetical protein [Methylobacterium sp. NEAU 140]
MPAAARREAFEMAFPRALVAQKARGREETVNEHLVKLLAFDVPEATRAVWRKELARHFRFLAALRVKPGASRIPARDWWTWLYADPFEDNEAGYTAGLIALNADDFARNGRGVDAVADRIRAFHAAMILRLEAGEAGEDLIPF